MTRATKNRQRVLGLAAAVTLALSACTGEGQSPEATDATAESATANQTQQSQPEPSDTEETPTTDSEATPTQTASDAVAPNDARVFEALQEAGWTCQGESRCRTQADQGEAVIELSDQRAFIMYRKQGQPDPSQQAEQLLSHTEAYGEALPDEGNFDTGKWADFVDWQKEHSGQRNARGDVNGWHVEYHVEGPTAKFIVTKRD